MNSAINPQAIHPMKTRTNTRRKEPTPEQKAAAQERREALKGLMAQVKAIPSEVRSKLASSFGIRNPEGRPLSDYNAVFLHFQRADVSIVGGFSQWVKLDRHVLKGSKALAIWIPTRRSSSEGPTNGPSEALTVPGDDTPTDSAGNRSGFMLASVFDITQTETTAEREHRKALEQYAPPLALPGPAAQAFLALA